MDYLSPAVRTTLRDLRVPSMLAVDSNAKLTYEHVNAKLAILHADVTCGVNCSVNSSRQAADAVDWDRCWNCSTPELTAAFRDGIVIASNYPIVSAFDGVGTYLAKDTFADCERAEVLLSGAMRELGFGHMARKTLFNGLGDPQNKAWAAPIRASLEARVRDGRSAFRTQFERVAFPTSNKECDTLMFIPDISIELMSAWSGANLRTHLVGYDWVAGGGEHNWAVVLVPSIRTTLRYFVRAANAGRCADLGPATRANPDVWTAFEAVYDRETISATDAMNVAVTIAATPALVPA